MKNHKYIFVIGGVMSGVGKGIATSSIGALLQAKGFTVNLMKVDPYLNVDAGTMNPTEHGEVFVLDSGLETDQDMGNYERFLNRDLASDDYMTSGMVYKHVIDKERALGYKGKFVEAIPHVTNEISRRFVRAAEVSKSDISVIEIGGTIGDYQNILFIEAARVLKLKNPGDVLFFLVSYLPVPGTIGEMKTRPTQNAVRMLNSYGVQPDVIIARGPVALDQKRKEKIGFSCSIPANQIISAPDIESVYDVPLNFEKDGLSQIMLRLLSLKQSSRKDGLLTWKKFVHSVRSAKKTAHIAIVGKYFDTGDFVLSDAYISVIEAVKYAAYTVGAIPKLAWLNAKDFENGSTSVEELKQYDGIIVPGGFGETGIEGKLKVIQYARENKIPYFGLCYGMQLAVVEYARNVLGLKDANTTEINPKTPHPVIDIMPEQKKHMADGNYGATMRLGAYPANLKEGTIARFAYGKPKISERHRHRYEVNPQYVKKIEKEGLVFSGTSPNGVLMEIAELPREIHPFFLGTQFHPEFKARPLSPHPLFVEFVKVAVEGSHKATE
ncbi:MAG: CTP synthase [Candidatus Taylorbacteria bacterium RIFCSPHIGHO2_01_FULL_46_22b]|uniref:CTP synthase n=1 Tax=Candidatus Taylorbacteria bacterium RIFCSPHIGHO2_01_FULL_46_22b TaxID=1802301 RepID=A0A1G2M2X7_9BACT|nr:MAG: CTP synthase [Candidatus Taylorbacteria bacterium RIFCSPHIGHO2_01_FULL_46_22b]